MAYSVICFLKFATYDEHIFTLVRSLQQFFTDEEEKVYAVLVSLHLRLH